MIEVKDEITRAEKTTIEGLTRQNGKILPKTRFVRELLRNSRAARSLSAQETFRSRKTVSKYYIYYET